MQKKLHILSSRGPSDVKRHLPRAALALACIYHWPTLFFGVITRIPLIDRGDPACARAAHHMTILTGSSPFILLVSACWMLIGCSASAAEHWLAGACSEWRHYVMLSLQRCCCLGSAFCGLLQNYQFAVSNIYWCCCGSGAVSAGRLIVFVRCSCSYWSRDLDHYYNEKHQPWFLIRLI